VLATLTSKPTSLAMDETDVYCITDDTTIWRVSKDGASAFPLVTSPGFQLSAIAVDATWVYFDQRDPIAEDGWLQSIPKSGGQVVFLSPALEWPPWSRDTIAVDLCNLYFRNDASQPSHPTATPIAQLARISTSGVGATDVGMPGESLVLDAQYAYAAESGGTAIFRSPK